jgi:hypothetical protein
MRVRIRSGELRVSTPVSHRSGSQGAIAPGGYASLAITFGISTFVGMVAAVAFGSVFQPAPPRVAQRDAAPAAASVAAVANTPVAAKSADPDSLHKKVVAPKPPVTTAPSPSTTPVTTAKIEPPDPVTITPVPSSPAATAAACMQHCVLYFSFDKEDFVKEGDQTIIRDHSVQKNDGVVKNAEPAEGKVKGGVRIDGNDHHIDVKDNPSLNPPSLTVSAWVNPRTLHGGWNGDNIISKDNWNPARGYVLRFAESGKTDFTIGWDGWSSVGDKSRQKTNEWTHLAAVYETSQLRLYINGVERKTAVPKAPLKPSKFKLRIGRGTLDTNRRFHGLIDEVALFAAPLTSADIQEIYTRGQAGQSLLP